MKPVVFNVLHFVGVILVFFVTSWILPVFSTFAEVLLGLAIAYYTLPFARKYVDKNVTTGDKSVLITGCDSGFGHALAKRLHCKGFHVFASCLFPSGQGAEDLRRSSSERIHVFGMDVTKNDSVKDAVKYVKDNLGKTELWAVVNNAGILDGFDIAYTELEAFEKSLEVNTLGVVRVTKAFLPLLQSSKGRLVTLTSMAGRLSLPQVAAYTMSKFAATAFCECLRQEMQPWGVKVITVEPELFKTPIANPDAICQTVDKCLSKVDEETKSMYGDLYFKKFKDYIRYTVLFGTSRIYKVIDCLQDAVILENPRTTYKPCRHTAMRIGLGTLEALPKPILDLTIRLGKKMTNFPTPKEANENSL